MTAPLIETDIAEFVHKDVRGLFRDCRLICREEQISAFRFIVPPNKRPRIGYRICLDTPKFRGGISVSLGPGTGHVTIRSGGSLNVDIRMFRQSSLTIGRGTTMNGARIICDESDVTIGRDNLWSDEIIVQSNDQHGIVDLHTGAVLNGGRRQTIVEDHVWIGRRTILMPDIRLGQGSILAAGAVLTGDMPGNTIFGGVPARLIRDNVTWSRSPDGLTPAEASALGLPASDPPEASEGTS